MMKHSRTFRQVLSGALLVTGIMIGVGMLAMPVATASGGFLPAIAIYLICWLFMLCTGLLFLEVCMWMPKESNMITMSAQLLGKGGKVICWIVYLFFFFTIMIAHVAAGGDILRNILGDTIPMWASRVVYVAIFSPIVFFGPQWVSRFNGLLVAGMVVSYLCFVGVAFEHVQLDLLQHSDWSKAWIALPILFTAFGYQAIIPTLMSYMEGNAKKVRLAIFIGTLIPLIVYLVWEFLILSTIPLEGKGGLKEAMELGQTAITPLKALADRPWLFSVGKAFAFFTLTASYIALALAFLDFLADAFRRKKTPSNKFWLCLLLFLPPTIVALSYPHIFLTALSYTGGFACAILFGLYPLFMVWAGRHYKHYPDKTRQLFGGRYLLTALILFVIFEIAIEFLRTFTQSA